MAPARPYELAPGASVTVTRFLAIGHSPVEALGLVAAQRGPVGQVTGLVRDKAGAPVSSAEILVRTTGDFDANVGVIHPDSAGHFDFALPEGKYSVTFTDIGRADVPQMVEVKTGTTTRADATMAIAAAIHFQITDDHGHSLPCKAQFLAIDGTDPVNLGPQNRAHGCVDQYHSEKGGFRVQIPPGKYRVIVTRGIEYSHLEQQVTLAPGATFDFAGKLQRLVNTHSWVSADYHNHSTQSGDNTCGTPDRIINLAAEHIQFAPTTEHNRLYDWRPTIEQLGLAGEIQTVSGMELTGSLAHLNSFPFKPVPFTQDNGAPVWDPDPRVAAITLRSWQGAEPDRWIQINHPDMVKDFIDSAGQGYADGGFQGLAEIDWRENCRHAKAGHSYLTTGPFLQVLTEDGAGPGETVRAVGGVVKLKVRVQCTDWIDIDRVQVLVNGRAVPELNFTRAANSKMFHDGVVKFDETITVPLHEASHLIVVACGEHSDLSVGYGTSYQAKMHPCAYHNPIFVDFDGHGFKPNGDTLGFPLPVARMTVEEARRQIETNEKSPK